MKCHFLLCFCVLVRYAFGFSQIHDTRSSVTKRFLSRQSATSWSLHNRAAPFPRLAHGKRSNILVTTRSTLLFGNKLSNGEIEDTTFSHHSERQSQPVLGVTLKLAFDLNGGVADLDENRSERFTSPESLDMVHRLRHESHAVLVGRNTVQRDDCSLTIRRIPLALHFRQPFRVIVDPQRKLQSELNQYKIATDNLESIVYHCHSSEDKVTTTRLTRAVDGSFPNVQWVGIPSTAPTSGRQFLSAKDIVNDLRDHYNVEHLMVEGGPTTARQFLTEGVIDRAILVYAPLEFVRPAPSNLSPIDFENAGLQRLGESYLGVDRVEYWSRPNLPWPTPILDEWP